MLKRICLFTASALALGAVALGIDQAKAADLPPPPIRPSIDWTGFYVGGVAGVACQETYYIPNIGPDPDLNGCGFMGGVVGGYNYQIGNFVVGVEGDYSWGDDTGKQQLDAVWYEIDNFATIRGRLGWLPTAETMIYATFGYGWLEGTMDALVGPASLPASDTKSHEGWVVGGGVEHAFTPYLHGRLEYLYASLDDKVYNLTNPGCPAAPCLADLDFEELHIIRAGLTFNFGGWFGGGAVTKW